MVRAPTSVAIVAITLNSLGKISFITVIVPSPLELRRQLPSVFHSNRFDIERNNLIGSSRLTKVVPFLSVTPASIAVPQINVVYYPVIFQIDSRGGYIHCD